MNTRPDVSLPVTALRWLARGNELAGGERVKVIVEQACRAGRLRLAMLAEEFAESVAVSAPLVVFATPQPRASAEILAEIEIFRKRLGFAKRDPVDIDDHALLRRECEAWVDELVAAEGESRRLTQLRAHVMLCDGRAAEAAALLEPLAPVGVVARQAWVLRIRALLGSDQIDAALAMARDGSARFPFDPWIAVASAVAATAADDREFAGSAFERVRALGGVAHAAARGAVDVLVGMGWTSAAAAEAFGLNDDAR